MSKKAITIVSIVVVIIVIVIGIGISIAKAAEVTQVSVSVPAATVVALVHVNATNDVVAEQVRCVPVKTVVGDVGEGVEVRVVTAHQSNVT